MGFNVFSQMVATHETLVAYWARKAFLTRVRTQMPLQFVGASEALATEQPIADKWPFAGVPAQMSLQMTGFTIHFAATGNMATVNITLSQV